MQPACLLSRHGSGHLEGLTSGKKEAKVGCRDFGVQLSQTTMTSGATKVYIQKHYKHVLLKYNPHRKLHSS